MENGKDHQEGEQRRPEYPPRLAALLERLERTDRTQRIELLIAMAGRYQEVPERVAHRPYPESHRVPHCESGAYVWAEDQEDGTLKYYFAIENPQGISARATAAILDRTLSGEPPEVVAEVSQDVIYRIFGYELSMGKNMGLTAMVGMVQAAARRRLAARD
jgi:cysteine desulfuration protein SufE